MLNTFPLFSTGPALKLLALVLPRGEFLFPDLRPIFQASVLLPGQRPACAPPYSAHKSALLRSATWQILPVFFPARFLEFLP